MKQKIELEVDVPDGWEVVEWRDLRDGDWYLSHVSGQALLSGAESGDRRFILRRVEPKRESRWINAYPCHHVNRSAARHETKADAVGAMSDMREQSKVIRIDYENGKPVNVALESVEEEG